MKFNEDSRVKIPTILHLMRLGYEYLSLKESRWDHNTNIFVGIFNAQVEKLNPDLNEQEVRRLYDEVSLCLENEDLGKVFYQKLTNRSGNRLIDFENFENNAFHVVTELPYQKDDDNFRPDIILLINGMPLAFIEVKKPNNLDGVQAERKRILSRFQNKKFRNFVNITQLMVFSNNMEYDDSDPEPLQGAFYAAPSYGQHAFNYFREEVEFKEAEILKPLNVDEELSVLKDNNLVSIRNAEEYAVNTAWNTPTNRICTSLFQKDRLAFILQYAIAYVQGVNHLEKHIMRYPQLFATKAIEQKLEEGITKGIIWHTQGSGKTALAFYNVKYLTDYYQSKSIIPKFYFIVDRLDLLIQASIEFRSRGLLVHNVNSKEEFAKEIKSTAVLHNDSGKAEITVVNIQKFKDDPEVVKNTDYNLDIQRIYFLDEVHRSYNPKGSFLANLRESDPNAIKIGLTGTPLLGDDYNSKDLFGEYIHKYYYNKSIKDGYTLRLIKEEIETSYKLKLEEALDEIKLIRGSGNKKKVYAHPKFVEPLLDYVIQDLEKFRLSSGDDTVGGMVICDSSDQAKEMQQIFNEKYVQREPELSMAAEKGESYGKQQNEARKVKTAQVILHDVGSKDDRKELVEDFKEGKIDFLFVFNMLLTGFDAKRLKKLYITRVIKAHNLLQALTRVNRTYKNHRYGYVVDFADIQSEFDKTNRDYFAELQGQLGDEMEYYTDLFKSPEEIKQEIDNIEDVLFDYNTKNAEVFQQQVSQINDRKEMLKVTKALNDARSLYNLIRTLGHYDLLEKLDFHKLGVLSREANNRLALINTREALETDIENQNLLNIALEDILFAFTKVNEEEMVLADQLKNMLQKTREALGGNFDPRDPELISLREELERLFKKKNLSEVSKEEMTENIEELEVIYNQAKELERKNQLLKEKYSKDEKYARLHKRLMEKDPITDKDRKLAEVLMQLKEGVDEEIEKNTHQLDNENYVEKMMMRLVIKQFKGEMQLGMPQYKRINQLLVKEYLNEYYGTVA
ncbi:MAG: DEAD/DEAH box helicase family protein [Vicingaceae bacterium]